ncbi:ARM repeat-containing protein [Basidiobolus meristosporus CBS 931.73]|uniref:ARM repeat-containing protein n=1 Tax=Basidiobolus meristosporus CBS 931.73 TaxID=1314790 RepID=A0A1Y1YAK5_9FUNG|nr:ARM repeat-containing protein [Basidiobolus meristosporus CBS 931.73]|eukprot:ORX95061.1 ARM repeat-containing protein [Basidiobolus meristosporus CBS 931.73]
MQMSAPFELDDFLSNLKNPVLDKKISALSTFEQASRDSKQEYESKQLDEAVQVLIHTVKSPQMNLCLAGLAAAGALLYQFEVYHPTLLKPYAPLLFPHLLDRLGDSKEKVREGALTELVNLWRLTGASPDIQSTPQKAQSKATTAVGVYFEKEMKAHGFNHKTWRVREQVLSWVVQCVKTVPDFSLKPYVPFIVKLLEDSHDLVREASKETLVTLFSSSSQRMRHDLAKELQKNNIRGTIVDSILGKIEANSKVMDSSCQAIETEQEPLQNPAPDDGIEQEKWEIGSHSTTTESDSLPPPHSKEHPEPSRAPQSTDDDVDVVHVYNSKDLENEFSNLATVFKGKETEDNWESRDRAWQRLRGIIRSDAPSRYQSTMTGGLRNSMTLILDTLHSLRTSLALSTLNLVKDLAVFLGSMLDPHLDQLLANLLKLNTQTKKLVAQASFETTCVVLRMTSYNHRTTNTITMAMGDKNVQLRGFVIGYVKVLLEAFGGRKEVFEKSHGVDSIENCIRKGVSDANPQVRESSRELFWVFWELWRGKGEALKKSFDPSTQKQLMRLRGHEAVDVSRSQTPSISVQNQSSRTRSGPRIDITSHDAKGPAKRKANQNGGLSLPKSPLPSKLPSPTNMSIPRLASHDGTTLSSRSAENSLTSPQLHPRSMSSMSFNRRCVSPKPTSPTVASRRAQTPSLSPPSTHRLRAKTPTLSPPSALRTLRSSTPTLTPPRNTARPRSPGVASPVVSGRRTPGIPSPSRPHTPHISGQRPGSTRPMTPGSVGVGPNHNRPNTPQSSLYGRSSTPFKLVSPTISTKSKLPKPTTIARPGTVFSRPTTPQTLHPSPPPSSTGSSSPRRRFGAAIPSRLDYQLRKLSVMEQLKHSDHTIRTAGINNLYHMYTSSPTSTDTTLPPGNSKSLPSPRVLAPILLSLFSDTHPKVVAQLVRTEVMDVMTRIIPLEQLFLAVLSQSLSLSTNDDTQINHPALPMLKAIVPEDRALDILCMTLQILKTPGGLRNSSPALSNMTTAERKKSVIRVLTWMGEIAEHALIWQNDHMHDDDDDESVFRDKTSIGEKAYLYFSQEKNMRHYLSRMLPYLGSVPPTAATYPLLIELIRKLMQLAPDVYSQSLMECEPLVVDKLEIVFGDSTLYPDQDAYQGNAGINIDGGFVTGADGKVEEVGDDNLLGLRNFVHDQDAQRITTTSNMLANRLDAIKLELERDEDQFALALEDRMSSSSNELDYFGSPTKSIPQPTPMADSIPTYSRKLSAFRPPDEGATTPFPPSLSDRYQMVATLISRLGTGNADSFTFRKLIRASRETSTEENPREAHEVWGQHGMFDNVITAILSFLQGPYHPEQKENCLLFVKHLLTNQAAFFQPYVREILNQLMDCRANEWNEVCSAAEDALDTFVMYMEHHIALEATSEWLDKALTMEETNPAAHQAWSSGPNPLATAFDIISRLIRRYSEEETSKLTQNVMPLVVKGFHDVRPEVRKSVVEVVVSLYEMCDQSVIDDSVMPDLTLSQRKLVTSYLELSGSHRFQ